MSYSLNSLRGLHREVLILGVQAIAPTCLARALPRPEGLIRGLRLRI